MAQAAAELRNITPFDEASIAVDDLFEEAQAWLNGDGIKSAAEAEAVEKLLDLARKAKKQADEARKEEKRPLDEQVKAIQDRYNPVLKRADMITDGCKAVLQPWRAAEEARKEEIARKEREEAERVRAEAERLMQESAGDIKAREDAEQMLASAKIAAHDAKKAAKSAATGTGLRRTWAPVLTDARAAIAHYYRIDPDAFTALVCDLAAKDVRAGKREIPGFDVIEQKKAV